MEELKYEILKVLKGNEEKLVNGEEVKVPFCEDFGLSNERFGKVVMIMEEEELIRTSYSRSRGIADIIFKMEITKEGKKYLKENSTLNQIYEGVKKVTDLIL